MADPRLPHPIPPNTSTGVPDPEIVSRLRAGFQGIETSFAALLGQFETALRDTAAQLRQSEADNAALRTRTRRDVDDARQQIMHKFGRDVVEATENLRRGLDSLPKPSPDEPEIVTRLREGFEGIERTFITLLERNGIDRQDPTGTLFDPNFHQSMAEQETTAFPAGTILHAWSHTWTLNGRLLRPGMVVVAKGGPPPAPLRVNSR